ncbi:MAG: heavy-metal-associated domain-containing protein [gamma proteobacterium symbiont of Bathyaustriella thionipta]|nr:heavy-metal-associated domain-containing protein [gamma proteobacterium symbiont of Bathyaustriella thionipta]
MKFSVENMKCGGCTSAVQQKLEEMDGCQSARVDLPSKTAEVEGDIDVQQAIKILTEAGYPARVIGS